MTKMDTKLSVSEINLLLRDLPWINKRTDTIIPNLSWGLLNHEADFCVINKSGYVTEIEIKRSFSDLKADFKKNEFHADERVRSFYYCLPLSIKEKAEKLFDENKEKIRNLYGYDNNLYDDRIPAVIYYSEDGQLEVHGWSDRYNTRKLFLEERVSVGRLMSLRYWDVIEKRDREQLNEKIKKNKEEIL